MPDDAIDKVIIATISSFIKQDITLTQPNNPFITETGDNIAPQNQMENVELTGAGLLSVLKRASDGEHEASGSKKHRSTETVDFSEKQISDMKSFPKEKPVIYYKKISTEQPFNQWPKYTGDESNRSCHSASYEIISRPDANICK